MRTIQLGRTGISSSILGFGCSALMGRSNKAESLRALGLAWDSGITFYDTARCYGYGESEAVLGTFFGSKRDQAIISTKFGILPSPQNTWKRVAKPLARAVLSHIPATRPMLMKLGAGLITHNQFTLEVLEKSVHESLRKLRTDYVDFLFMHDAPLSAIQDDELISGVQRLVTAGKVRFAGISSSAEVTRIALRDSQSKFDAVQFACNALDLSTMYDLEHARKTFVAIANHPFGGVECVKDIRSTIQRLAISKDLGIELRTKLQSIDDAVLADVVLNVLLMESTIHVVVPAMMKPKHIESNVNAVSNSRFTSDDVRSIRTALANVTVAS